LTSTSFTFSFLEQVLHGSDQDILWLQRDLGLYVVNMFDTGQVRQYEYHPFFFFVANTYQT
ncbi:unnamed protein product, partial [Laminaria digitata]